MADNVGERDHSADIVTVSSTPVRRRLGVATFAALLLLAGCSGDDDTEAASAQATASTATTDTSASDAGGTLDSTTEPTATTRPDSADTTATATAATTLAPAPTTTDVGAAGTDIDADTTTADATEGPDLSGLFPGSTVPAELSEPADFGNGVTGAITKVEAIEVEAHLPGERSGPGVRLTVEITNDSAEPISLDFVIVDLIGRDGASALPIETFDDSQLSGELAPGATASGRYEYFIPAEQRPSATVTVSYNAVEPTALFTGDLPDV